MFASFLFVSTKYSLPSNHLFRFFQVRHFVKKLFPHFPNCPPECPLDHFLTLSAGQKHLISVIYTLISALNDCFSRESWEHELGISVTDDQWGDISNLVHSSSICARHGIVQCKVLYRAHLTNSKLAKKKCREEWGLSSLQAISCQPSPYVLEFPSADRLLVQCIWYTW